MGCYRYVGSVIHEDVSSNNELRTTRCQTTTERDTEEVTTEEKQLNNND